MYQYPCMDLWDWLGVKAFYCKSTERPNIPKMNLLLSNNDMACQTNLVVHVQHFFGEIKVVSSFPKTTRHNRMKQRLECRMLRDRCKTFISDHLFQELPQDANDDLQNPQRGRSTLGGIFIRGIFSSWLNVLGYFNELWLSNVFYIF